MKSRGPRAGFTLLELVVVLFLISIAVSIVSASLVPALNSSKLEAAAVDISSAMRQARTLAGLKGREEDVLINLDSKNFGIEDASGVQQRSKHIGAGINIKAIGITGDEVASGVYKIAFFPSGAVEGGSIIVWNRKKWFEISPDPIMGFIESSGRGGWQL